mgnify:CR=1 FL=1
MNILEFVSKLKVCNFTVFENEKILQIIKGCDDATRETFFPQEPAVLGVNEEWKNVAIKLVEYTISVSGNYIFNSIDSIKGINYASSVGKLLKGNQNLWQDILEMLVNSICLGLDDTFFCSFFEETSQPQFIQGVCEQLAQYPKFPKLCFEMVCKYTPQKYEEYYKRWKEIVSKEQLVLFTDKDYFSSYESSDKLKDGIAQSVWSAMNLRTEYVCNSYYEHRTRGVATPIHDVITIREKRWVTKEAYNTGKAVCNWLGSMGVNHLPNVHTDQYVNCGSWETDSDCSGGGGCVTGDTMILLADGNSRKIRDIVEGDRIRNGEGNVSETSNEKIINHSLGCLYGINDIRPFMSLEHAVMTTEGWKSLDPTTSNEINPHYKVGLLREGDKVITLEGEREVTHITRLYPPEGTMFTGYDLHFREGSDSYYANGLLVLLNYPEITLVNILKNIQKMELTDINKFIALFRENTLIFEQVFGKIAINQFQQMISEIYGDNQ